LHREFHEWRFDFRRNVDTRDPEIHDGHGDSALRRSAMHYEATTPMLFRKIMKATGAHSMPEAFFEMVYQVHQSLHHAIVILT
jgi:hypothetical protein